MVCRLAEYPAAGKTPADRLAGYPCGKGLYCGDHQRENGGYPRPAALSGPKKLPGAASQDAAKALSGAGPGAHPRGVFPPVICSPGQRPAPAAAHHGGAWLHRDPHLGALLHHMGSHRPGADHRPL